MSDRPTQTPRTRDRVTRPKPLTAKQALFVRAYLTELNATKAAIMAGYSAKNAEVIGPRLVRKSTVAAAINEGLQERATRLGISADRTLLELAIVAFSTVEHYTLDAEYNLVPADGAPPFAMRAVSHVRHKVRKRYNTAGELVSEEHHVEFRLWDKNTALTNLAKHTGVLLEPDKAGDTTYNIQVVRYGDAYDAPPHTNGHRASDQDGMS